MTLFSVTFIACATQPEQKPIPQVKTTVTVEKSRIPDRPLKFGEEFVFSVEKPVVDVASLDEESNDSVDCLISQSAIDSPGENIADYVQKTLKQKWIKPRNISKHYQCEVALFFSANGCVTEIEITGCKDNIQLVRSIESALFRSAPFPAIGGALAGDRFQFEFFAGP